LFEITSNSRACLSLRPLSPARTGSEARRSHEANLFRRNTFFHESVTSHQKTKAPIATSVPRVSSIFITRNVELIRRYNLQPRGVRHLRHGYWPLSQSFAEQNCSRVFFRGTIGIGVALGLCRRCFIDQHPCRTQGSIASRRCLIRLASGLAATPMAKKSGGLNLDAASVVK